MNDLQIFNSEEFGEIRTVTIDNEPWFVGKDVAEALGYQNGSRDINNHVEESDRKVLSNQNYQNGTLEIPNRGLISINESVSSGASWNQPNDSSTGSRQRYCQQSGGTGLI